ncbi:MAG: hypothetical protein LBO75_04155, partial [Bifidobacteriaceae bacterium]|nr:hypothetical protein [Bifidobacteriaceae bacterium]
WVGWGEIGVNLVLNPTYVRVVRRYVGWVGLIWPERCRRSDLRAGGPQVGRVGGSVGSSQLGGSGI